MTRPQRLTLHFEDAGEQSHHLLGRAEIGGTDAEPNRGAGSAGVLVIEAGEKDLVRLRQQRLRLDFCALLFERPRGCLRPVATST